MRISLAKILKTAVFFLPLLISPLDAKVQQVSQPHLQMMNKEPCFAKSGSAFIPYQCDQGDITCKDVWQYPGNLHANARLVGNGLVQPDDCIELSKTITQSHFESALRGELEPANPYREHLVYTCHGDDLEDFKRCYDDGNFGWVNDLNKNARELVPVFRSRKVAAICPALTSQRTSISGEGSQTLSAVVLGIIPDRISNICLYLLNRFEHEL